MEGQSGHLGRIIGPAGRIAAAAGRALFPHFCLECGQEGKLVCPECWEKNKNALKMGVFWCPGCGLNNDHGMACGPNCRQVSGLDAAAAMLPYNRRLPQRLLRIWKYQSVDEAGRLLLDLFKEWIRRESVRLAGLADSAGSPARMAVVPVPLHPFRLAERGFNQAMTAADIVASVLGGQMRPDLLQRNWQWKKQAKMADEGQRRRNASGSVRLRPAVHLPERVLLVDDVMTTGATLRECARRLRQAGCQQVAAVTVLRG